MSNPADIKVLGKALEEAGELIQILARCLIQGINESDPRTGKPNTQALAEEIADCYATSGKALERFLTPVQQEALAKRIGYKYDYLSRWVDMPVSTVVDG